MDKKVTKKEMWGEDKMKRKKWLSRNRRKEERVDLRMKDEKEEEWKGEEGNG